MSAKCPTQPGSTPGLHRTGAHAPSHRHDGVTFGSLLLALALAAVATFLLAPVLQGQSSSQSTATNRADDERDPADAAGSAARRMARAVRIEGVAPVIDGDVSDPAWQAAPVLDGFVQYEPLEGAPPSQRTELRILYSEDALYVAAWLYDSAPDSVVAQLTRRDQSSHSDRILISLDSYFDRRTAFDFALNPLGVKLDLYRYDDTSEDSGWDAVWDGAARLTEWGWSAEFRIPLSQLRFAANTGNGETMTWGFNAIRTIARNNERTVWAPLSRQEQGVVSRFGDLEGLEGIEAPRRLELIPYTVVRGSRVGGDPANPFWSKGETDVEVGGDLRFGVTGNLTLNLTVNPDFGQVEADPSQVNLTAFETFLPERRPFFVEGANIFNVRLAQGDGDGSFESLFYSRRIGRAPQGSVDTQGGWSDQATQSRILAAWKLSGKTEGGRSVGLLHAVTGEEKADVFTGAGERFQSTVEPFTNYGVLRVQQDFREGRSAVGIVATATNREAEGATALGLRTGAYTAGVDARHRWGNDRYQAGASFIMSHIRGSEEAILAAQQSPGRYFQRPDADHVTLDPTRTSLTGWSAMFDIGKMGGGHWRYAVGGRVRSPGFEANDLGFMQETDFASPFVWAGYRETVPGRLFQNWGFNLNGWTGFTFGGERTNLGGNVNGHMTLLNFWNAYGGINRDAGGDSPGLLRGGPLFRREPGVNGWAGINSDSRKQVQVNWHHNWSIRRESDSWSYNTNLNIRWRPSGRASISVGPFLTIREEDRQWVSRVSTGDDPHYIFGRLDQTTAGLTARLDMAFTPDLTLQIYAQPFLSSGRYGGFKRVADPLGARYRDRFEALDTAPVQGGSGGLRTSTATGPPRAGGTPTSTPASSAPTRCCDGSTAPGPPSSWCGPRPGTTSTPVATSDWVMGWTPSSGAARTTSSW
jgi:hypothetical protein